MTLSSKPKEVHIPTRTNENISRATVCGKTSSRARSLHIRRRLDICERIVRQYSWALTALGLESGLAAVNEATTG